MDLDYQEKLRLAKKALDSGSYDKETIEYIFPELKKSEDEGMRKFISHELACLRATDENGSDRYKELTNAITWLEKQGEQKPAWIETDAFIEKATEWLKKNADDYTWYDETEHESGMTDEFIDDFKNYMKGE